VRLIESIAGSWKVKFSVAMEIVGQAEGVEDLYDRIMHQDYLKDLETVLKMSKKKKASTRVVWKYVCETCYEKYNDLDQGLLCTGRVPHWFCSECLSRDTRVKLERAQPDLRCIDQSCEAMYINTHLLNRVMAFTRDPSFYAQYTQVSLMEYKRDHPYPQHAQCDNCGYLEEPQRGQGRWTCGEGCPPSWRNNGRPCDTQWCLQCTPMRQVHTGPHRNSSSLSIYNQVCTAISQGFIIMCSNKCQALVKDGGCNHMTCQSCGQHFCFICDQNLDSAKGGYDWGKNGHSCPQFGSPADEERHNKRKACEQVRRLMQENGWSMAQVQEAAGTALAEIGFA